MAQDINIAFSRELLSRVHLDVQRQLAVLAVNHIRPDLSRANLWRSAWVHSANRITWEFHGPDGFLWWGRAHNAYEARAKGWQAWLNKNEAEAA